MSIQKPVIVIGSGGHARVLIDCLRVIGRDIAFVTDVDPKVAGTEVLGAEVRGDDHLILDQDPTQIELVNGIGSVGRPALREKIFGIWTDKGYQFTSLIHPSAIVAPDVILKEGVQIMAGAIVQTGSVLHENSIINTGASIDHNGHIGAHCHLAPKVTLSGSVSIGKCSHIGTAACVIQEIKIGDHCVVGAGATVITDLPSHSIAVGTPARRIHPNKREATE